VLILHEADNLLELLLEVKVYHVNSTPYYRLLLPKRISDRLGLQKGDMLQLELKRVTRQGTLVHGDPDDAE